MWLRSTASCTKDSDYNRPTTPREREFKEAFERDLPEYAKMCQGEAPVIIFHRDAFAADYQPSEFSLLGMAIKYAGLMGKEVRIIGQNRATLAAIQWASLGSFRLLVGLPTASVGVALMRVLAVADIPRRVHFTFRIPRAER